MGCWKTVETLRDKAFGGKCSLGPCPGRVCFTSIPFLSLSVSWVLWGEQVFSTTWPNTRTGAMERVTVAQRLWDYEPAWNPSSFRMLVFCHGNREFTIPLSSQFCQKHTHLFSFKQDVPKWLLRKWPLLLHALIENRKSAVFVRKRNAKQLRIPNGVLVP